MVIAFETKCSKNNSNKSDNDGLTLEIQEFVGNHKEFRIENNHIHLRIIGNNNRVILKSNEGKLDIIGHATKAKIGFNSGSITYIGNNGKIYLGRESKVTSVQYTGNRGCVKLLDKPFVMPRSKSQEKSSTTQKETDQNVVNSLLQQTISVNVKNNISLPNLEDIAVYEQKLQCSTTFKISSSSSDLHVNNFFRKSSAT